MRKCPQQLNIRLTPREWQRFERVARHHGLNQPNLVRMLVAQEGHRISDAAAQTPDALANALEESKVGTRTKARADVLDVASR